MNEQERIALGIIIASHIDGRPVEEQVNILFSTILAVVDAHVAEARA